MGKSEILRIIDANLNRAREGLRVCEDIVRFFINHKELTGAFKSTRHNLDKISHRAGFIKDKLLRYRDSRADVGKNLCIKKNNKRGIIGLFSANIQRSEEAIRVLEEVTQLIDPGLERYFRKVRFKLYTLEAKAYKKLVNHVSTKF